MKDVKLINQNFLEKKLKESKEQAQDNSTIFLKWHNDNRKEEAIQSDFLNDIFGKILGYEIETDKEYNLDKEYKTQKDGTKVDGVLGFFTKESKNVKAVVELKGKNTNNLDEIEKQAFEYRDKIDGIEFVITSNTEEIRLYSAKSGGRLKYQSWTMLELSQSIEKQKEFHFLLSKQNLIGIDKNAISNTKKLIEEDIKREDEIKAKFYKEYKDLREEFVKDILKQNQVSNDDAISKTQKLLDRLLFVRFCEDNNFITKPFEKVDFAKQLGFPLWDSMKQLFIAIDKGNPPHIHKFNGGLFATDELFDSLKISTNLLEKLIGFLRLYHFKNDISVHILGHIFEQSITDLEALKAGLTEENFDKKQGKRKKDGIFYTPEYITKYIVEEAVGGWLNDRKNELEIDKIEPQEVPQIKSKKWINPNAELINKYKQYAEKLKQIKVLDPACGSGAFLVEVFHYLENEWLTLSETLKKLGDIDESGLFNYKTIYKSILQNNIYGVDLNHESVQITKLSLWLKTANLNDELTTLDNNIKCGNSLIDDPEIAGEKAFKWEEEFPFKFDVVVGNPPYVFAREKISQEVKDFYVGRYKSAQYQVNTYLLFIEQALNLIKISGSFGLIVPNAWLMVQSAKNLRELLLKECSIKNIVNLTGESFENVSVETIIIHAVKICSKNNAVNILEKQNDKFIQSYIVNQSSFEENEDKSFKIFINDNNNILLEKIQQSTLALSEVVNVKAGLKAYESGKGMPKQTAEDVTNRIYDYTYKFDEGTYKYLEGKDVLRYGLDWSGTWLKYGNNLAAPRTFEVFNGKKIIIREITGQYPKSIIATYSEDVYLFNMSNIAVLPKEGSDYDLRYILAILNSSVISYYFRLNTPKSIRQMFPKIILQDLAKFPIKKASAQEQQPFIEKAQTMLTLTKQLNEKTKAFVDYFVGKFKAKLPTDKKLKLTRNLENWHTLDFADFMKELNKQKIVLFSTEEFDFKPLFEREKQACNELQSQISKTDAEIDKMVYALYGLSEEEISVVEGLV
ncbi:Eco57I restriction-modification methylase domain-containing protein [Candidatus Deianiraea vastatrix]|uniref:site-specific DNA-methyltransferase (adenine-specific) n=1 Tax=Candidatus Deianiraea vastatrix TaxID=2163644 RepID=A0A5B8XGH2_9RICK|nr:N-6 DNA methylase [Candidatus Deianiraea vastatrix]QED23027.1 Putative Type IIS restriction/modification enzyme [Candidatus Deianiraea vastatrix]